MEFTVEVDSLLLRRFLEQPLVCVAVSTVEGVDVSGGGGSFRLPRRNYGTSNVYHPIFRLWTVPILTKKLSNQREMYGFCHLPLESYIIFVAYIRVAFKAVSYGLRTSFSEL